MPKWRVFFLSLWCIELKLLKTILKYIFRQEMLLSCMVIQSENYPWNEIFCWLPVFLYCSVSVFTMTVNSCQAKSAVNYWWFQVESICVLCHFLSGWTRNMLCELLAQTVGWQLTCWKKKVRTESVYTFPNVYVESVYYGHLVLQAQI